MQTEAAGAPLSAEQHPGGTRGAETAPQAATDAPAAPREPVTDAARAAAHFAADATTHKLTVRREDGVFRHVEFTGLAGLSRIVLITWPYNLIATGSHGTYHFERYGDDTEDMLNWIRGTRPNPSSWASKLVNGRDSVTEYDRDKLIAEVNERVEEAIRDDWAPDGLKAAVHEQILNSGWLDQEQNALSLVDEFEYGVQHQVECSCGATPEIYDDYGKAVSNSRVHQGRGEAHQVRIRQIGGFDFDDVADWNVRKLSYHYLWTCHAMVWAVRQYDAARAAEAVSA